MKANENWNLGLNWSESECLKVKLGEALNIATKSIINWATWISREHVKCQYQKKKIIMNVVISVNNWKFP